MKRWDAWGICSYGERSLHRSAQEVVLCRPFMERVGEVMASVGRGACIAPARRSSCADRSWSACERWSQLWGESRRGVASLTRNESDTLFSTRFASYLSAYWTLAREREQISMPV